MLNLNRVTMLAIFSMLILGLAGCGAGEPVAEQPQEAAPPPPPPVPVYELTTDDVTTHADWTSRNISILGLKLGDATRSAESNFGKLDNTRTLADEYLTIYQNNGLFVYTFKLTGKATRMEVQETFAEKIKDANLKRLLDTGSLDYMRELLGQEEGVEENAEDQSTEYVYDSRGIRVVMYKVGNQSLTAIRFVEPKKADSTT